MNNVNSDMHQVHDCYSNLQKCHELDLYDSVQFELSRPKMTGTVNEPLDTGSDIPERINAGLFCTIIMDRITLFVNRIGLPLMRRGGAGCRVQ